MTPTSVVRGSIEKTRQEMTVLVATEDYNRASDQMISLESTLNDFESNIWFKVWHDLMRPEPLDNSFDRVQRWRRRTRHEAHTMRFGVSLWAAVKIARAARPQVAEQLRKMARFLESQAEAVDQMHADRKGGAA
jgi:hypothetical protein